MSVDLALPILATVDPVASVVVLLITPDDNAHRRLEAIFGHSNWSLRRACRWEDAETHLRSGPIPVVVTGESFDGLSWRELWRRVRACQSAAPRFIVASRLADDPLWQEVLDEGGYNVLSVPFDAREVYWVVGRAWLDWKNQLGRKTMVAAG